MQRTHRQLRPQYARYYRDLYRLEHVRRWDGVEVDWLRHAADLAVLSPAPDQVVLDGWSGNLQVGSVQFDRRESTWSTPAEMSILLQGEATSRAVADTYRAALVDDARYRASAAGAETEGGRRLAHGFSYTLRAQPDEGGEP